MTGVVHVVSDTARLDALIGVIAVVGIALFGATFRLGSSIGSLNETTKILLQNDKAHDDRFTIQQTNIAEIDRRVSHLEGWRPTVPGGQL